MLKSVDRLRRDVHFIIEEVALREINSDPVGFIKREAGLSSKGYKVVREENDLWYNMSVEDEPSLDEDEFNIPDDALIDAKINVMVDHTHGPKLLGPAPPKAEKKTEV